MLEAERMFTETIFLERTIRTSALFQYMEMEDYAVAIDAYDEPPNFVARCPSMILERVIKNPEPLGSHDSESEYEPLVHAIAPDWS